MAAFADYEEHDGLGLAALVRDGEVSADELLEAAIERIEARNPALNAVVHKTYDAARARIAAGLPVGPFTGVPYLLKDLYAFEAGVPCGNGSALWQGYVAEEDGEMVRRARQAGLVFAGRSNTPEFGVSVTTEPAVNGATRNPWDLSRSPGGSSGGAAAAVAAGLVPLAHASDGGGSIRIPAAACGLFGLKPTRARNPNGEGWAGLTTHHAVSRSVRDSAALLDATQGYLPGYPYCAPPRERPFLEEVGADPGRLKIAWTIPPLPVAEVHPACRQAVEDAAVMAESLGHFVEQADLPVDLEALTDVIHTIVCSYQAAELAAGHPVTGEPVRQDEVEPMNWILAELGKRHTALDLIASMEATKALGSELAPFFDKYDLVVLPTLAQPAVPLGTIDSQGEDLDAFIQSVRSFAPFTQLFNMSGQPAMSLPLHWSDEGLPVGVQFAARFGEEATLFRLAAQFEQACPWWDRRPPVAGYS